MNLPDRERWGRISPLLDELLDLDAAGQARRLAELAGHDAAVAAELEDLLAVAGRVEATNFLARGVQFEAPSASTLAGRTIGPYVLESHLGDGGSGSVWRARRADGRFESRVAIKLLHLSLIGRGGALRFEREGAILARLVHPNIAHLMDAGVTADGQPYLVLELVEGERFDRYCALRRLGVEQRLKLFDDVLAAVAHAHSHLVIHRDIKPGNVIVTADGTVKLLDFGIAKLLQDEGADATITAEGQLALTPHYAAPEQVRGGPVTTATDVYALGVLLYQLLAGHHPTALDTASSMEVLRATLDTEPLRLTGAFAAARPLGAASADEIAAERGSTPARLKRRLRGDLENIVGRALRKEPLERYQTVAALREDLRRHLAYEPVSARPDSLAYRLGKLVRRRRGPLAASALVVLALLAGLAGTLSESRRAEAQARRAEAQALRAAQERDRAQRQQVNAESAEEFLSFLLSSAANKPFTVSELLARGETLARQQFADHPVLRARLLLSLSGLTSELDEQERTLALLREARAAAASTADTGLQAAIDCAIASDLSGEPDAARAAATFDAALARLGEGPDVDRTEQAACLNQRAMRALEAGDAPGATRDGQAALAALGAPHPGQRSLAVAIRMNLAGARARSGDLPGSIGDLRQVLDELRAMGRAQTVGAATLHNNLAVLLAQAGNPLAALAAAQQAVQHYGDAATDISVPVPLLLNLSYQLLAVGRQAEAEPLFERALQLAAQRGDTRTPAYGAAGFNHCPGGQAARCERRIDEARRTLAGFLPPQHKTFGVLETTKAELALARGRPQEARSALLAALRIFDQAARPDPGRIRAAALLARTELALGHPEAAAQRAAEAVDQGRALARGFAHSAPLGAALVAQGLVDAAAGRHDAAMASWRAALTELHATVGDAATDTVELRRLLAGA